MIITIDEASATPPYDQIRQQIGTMAASGVLQQGLRLPTIRQLAIDLNVAPGTVTRAYRELEGMGIIVSRGRHGTFIEKPKHLASSEREALLATEANHFTRIAKQLGFDVSDIVAAVQLAFSGNEDRSRHGGKTEPQSAN